jgi:hypothetical protein
VNRPGRAPAAGARPGCPVPEPEASGRDFPRAVEYAGAAVRHGQQGSRVEDRDVDPARVDVLDEIRVIGAIEREAAGPVWLSMATGIPVCR